ncbi:MAG: 6-phosphogluconolactonase, partial [Rhodospirillales bacterium]|nr:6-phosphogluconolactonase [Rhodospirillales bacterium]
ADRGALARLLADEVATVLEGAIRDTGRAALAVPGGTTPAAFLAALGGRALDWAAVAVTLTDERCVPADHPRSNRRLLDETLFAGTARAARFVALDDAQALSALLPLDACVLGMGEDLHIASLFPGADRLGEALSADCGTPTLRLHAPGAPEARISLTAPVLTGAGRCFVLIHGAEKRAALDQAGAAAGPADAPVRLVLDAPHPATVYWAP